MSDNFTPFITPLRKYRERDRGDKERGGDVEIQRDYEIILLNRGRG
jgi:hypothetical protein